ncbi:MAG: hypothetical protein IKA05_01455 [Clostridia bacterium]|nr:hypothetical protein [Clostridia bacterium]
MKIVIREEERKTRTFQLPSALLLNRFSAMLIRRALKKKGVTVTRKQTARFLKALKHYKCEHRDWKLLEICDKKNQHVEITL